MRRLSGCALAGLLLLPLPTDAAQAQSKAQSQSKIMPKEMHGAWASDPAACAEQSSELRMTIESKFVTFYETGYEIKSVARLPDGFVRASGFHVTDDSRARDSLLLKLIAPDKIQIGKTDGQIYHRCPKT